jgi:hypothetical protein
MLAEHLARHVLGDLLVVLKLALVARKESSGDAADAGLPPRLTSSLIMTG